MQLSHPSESAHPGGTAPRCAGVVLWDFDQYGRYHRNTLIKLFCNLLKRLEADGVVRSTVDVHTIAFGLSRSFRMPGVTSALTNMCVEMRLVSDAKREETDRQLERAAREQAGDPAVEAIVILSSDKDFNGLVRDLRFQANKRVYVVHDAPRGAPHEELLSLYATGTYRIDDFVSSPQRSCFVRRCTQPSYSKSQQKRVSPDKVHLLYNSVPVRTAEALPQKRPREDSCEELARRPAENNSPIVHGGVAEDSPHPHPAQMATGCVDGSGLGAAQLQGLQCAGVGEGLAHPHPGQEAPSQAACGRWQYRMPFAGDHTASGPVATCWCARH